MANYCTYKVLSLTYLAALAVVIAVEDDASAFNRLKDDVFGLDEEKYDRESYDTKIERMIALLKTEGIPAEVQGNVTLDYLVSLVEDCKVEKTCDLDVDLGKVRRMKQRESKSPRFRRYRDRCIGKVQSSCANHVYTRVGEKLRAALDENVWDVIRRVSAEADYEMSPRYYHGHLRRSRQNMSEIDLYKVVLTTLKEMDPDKSAKVAKKWTKKEKSLRKLMDRIREPCVTFLENVDPIIDDFPVYCGVYSSKDPMHNIMSWNFHKKICRRIVDEWEDIVKQSYAVYKSYLECEKEESVSCWGGYSSGGGGGGFSTSDLIWIGAGR